MPQYEVQINVMANRIEDHEPEVSTPIEGVDFAGLQKVMKNMGKVVQQVTPPGSQDLSADGIRLRKTIVVRAESFAAIAEVLGKFDSMAEQLELESTAQER